MIIEDYDLLRRVHEKPVWSEVTWHLHDPRVDDTFEKPTVTGYLGRITVTIEVDQVTTPTASKPTKASVMHDLYDVADCDESFIVEIPIEEGEGIMAVKERCLREIPELRRLAAKWATA
jgi:hypothetical protein